MNRERLLNVARALRESKEPENFRMGAYAAECGTPACAIGHYAHRQDLQQTFSLNAGWLQTDGRDVDYDDDEVLEHFDIGHGQAVELFSGHGCGGAKTATEAAEYIENFVARHS